jgi:hypothetical protein
LRTSVLALALSGCGLFAPEPVDDVAPIPVDCRPAGAAATSVAPWPVGSTTASGWKVTTVEDEHPEFTRIGFEKDGVATKIEIKLQDAEPDDWSTRHYKLMPAPGETPPEPLLLEVMSTLKQVDQASGGAPIAAEPKDPWAGKPPCPT